MKYVIYAGVFFMPDKNAAAHRAVAISKIIETLGYKPVVIGMNSDITQNNIVFTEKEYAGIKVFEMKYPKSSIEWVKMLFNYMQIVRVIEYLGIENCQALILMDYYSPALKSLLKYCKRKNLKMILDTVDWFGKSSYKFPINIIKNFDTFVRMHFLNKKTKNLITISSYLEEYYKKHVENLVRIPGVYFSSENQKTIKYEPNNVRIISFVGSPGKKCEKEKIDWVIKAVCKSNKECIKIKFIIAGIDRITLQKNRPDLFKLEHFDESIDILGKISYEECKNLIMKSDFSIIIREDNLLSRAGFPTKLGEAYAFGTPVLATPTSDIRDYVPAGYGIVTKTCTYDDVEKSIFDISNMESKQIISMHEMIKYDNPLDYKKYVSIMEKIIKNF